MKCSLIALIVQFTLTGILWAATSNAQNIDQVKVNLTFNQVSLQQCLLTLQKKSGVQISFADQLLAREKKKVTLDEQNISVRQAIQRILSSTSLTYRQERDYVIIDAKPVPPKPGNISGKILDEKNGSLPGASIKIIGTGKAVSSGVDGHYNISMEPGTYTIEISFMGYQTRRITGVVVSEGKNTPLDVTLKTATGKLNEVVVTASYRAASAEGLYNRQKNNAHVTDGISADQISRTPDINIGQVLNRISGVTTVSNKYVIVRGLSERYNQAMIDGIVLPSTSMNRRNFSFDVIPQELVSNVVVNKTATPDMSAEFSGGQVIINTIDIPSENFTSITIGTGYNTQSTGKDFLMAGSRGKYDYLGFDDGRRKEPAGLIPWQWQNNSTTPPPGPPGNTWPNVTLGNIPYSSFDAIEQSKRLSSEAYKVSRYRTAPDQQYRLALGRVYRLDDKLRLGFSGGLTYRNQQRIVDYNNVRGATLETNWIDSVENGAGKSYRFNTTWGAALNIALEGKNFKLALKNMYSRIFDESFNEAYRLDYDEPDFKFRELFDDPQVTSVWQHKLEGEQQLTKSGLKLEYTAAINRIGQQVMDQRRIKYNRTMTFNHVEYFQSPNVYAPGVNGDNYDYRLWTQVKETDYNWGLSFSQPFRFLGDKGIAKIGYSGWDKQRTLGITRMVPYTSQSTATGFEQPYEEILDTAKIGAGAGQAYYWAEALNGPAFKGSMNTHAIYGMLDQRFFHKLRLIYGIRVEYYNLANRQEDFIRRQFGNIPDAFRLFSTTGEKNWRILPSANLIYSLNSTMNIRAAYSKTAIRPDFRETAYFGFYDFELDGNISGRQVVSTIAENIDLRYEWYPSPGEVISLSGFYKNLDQPIELVATGNSGYYSFQNQHRAVNYGMEIEFRKSLGFIANRPWLKNLVIFGNGTLLKSNVEVQWLPLPGDNTPPRRYPKQDRPLYGQAPWIINGGISYQGEIAGFTASYNRSGPRSFSIDPTPTLVEYENGRNMLDLQLNARLFKKKAELKLNLGNLLNEYTIFYRNNSAYELRSLDEWKLVKGTVAYEKDKGDIATYRSRNGRTASVSITYKL